MKIPHFVRNDINYRVILSRQAKDPCSLYREAKDPSLRSG